MTESYIQTGPGHTTFVGPDATRLYTVTVLRHAIDFYLRTRMKVNRSYTPTNMLAVAGGITGKTYKRGQLKQASADLQVWIDAMKAAMPIEHKEASSK